MDILTERIFKEFIEVEASGRHVHLSRKAIDQLFGKGYLLTKDRDLSQPGQFVCRERVTVIGPKGRLENVVILGPERGETQVEVSLTDSITLGLSAPVRESGNLSGTPAVKIATALSELDLPFGVIVAKRHIHMTPEAAFRFNVKDKEIVSVQVFGNRPLIFDDVLVRVSDKFQTYMHIDYDEANACGFEKGTLGRIKKKGT
ncbi:phosphate propanoyltransferase [Bacillus marasmi]|uniref:phosphate propanoyltransferase n=1 Tax=Bacillus marasmi TaxID=1926279 RepID=UPI0011C85A06|nr:phosphate propanoyltransferase [Bacillus marasmi]